MKNLFFIPKLLKRGSFFIHIFASKLLKNSLQSLGMGKIFFFLILGRKTNFWQSLGIKIVFYPSNILPHNFGSPTIIHIIFFLIYLLYHNESFKVTTTQQIEEF